MSFTVLCGRYVGNIHTKVTEGLLAEVFSNVGPLEGCKLIRKEKVPVICYAFYFFFFFLVGSSIFFPVGGGFTFGVMLQIRHSVYFPFIVVLRHKPPQ